MTISKVVFALSLILLTCGAVATNDYQGHFWDGLARRYSVPVSLLKSIAIVESQNGLYTLSHTGDVGLMQISPANQRYYKVNKKCLTQHDCNARVGANILSYMKRRYGLKLGWECRYNIGVKLSQNGTACKRYLAKLKAAGYDYTKPGD